jgi:hypothetical protein
MNNPSLTVVPVTLDWNNALAPLEDPVITLKDLDAESVTRRPPPAVTIPTNSAAPAAVIVPPTPEAPISNPPLAVTIPIESTLVTSS